MKPAALLLALLLATAAFGGEKKTDPRAFRMPAKSAKPKVGAPPRVVEVKPPVQETKPVVGETKPVAAVPAFRFPDAPKPAPAAAPDAPAVTKKPASPRSFALPGDKPAPPRKKNPVTFRMPEKKSGSQGSR